jgi:exosortase C (VPDSG-CTERM-specific)
MSPDTTPADRPLAEARFARPISPWREFSFAIAILAGVFIVPLWRLFRYATEPGSLYSHILLIPLVSFYLVWIYRKSLQEPGRGSAKAFIPFAITGAGLLLLLLAPMSEPLSRNDFLSVTVGSFYCFFLAAALFCLGNSVSRQMLFPLAFLVFIVPFPDAVTAALEAASKHASAETYALLMNFLGATHYREGLVFALPGLTIEVAQECSGIRSSLVLFITSLVAGYMFLSKARNRAMLSFFVLPLGVVRNAFRILVLSLLTIHWDERVIDSPLHHRGGPIFFALSLIPFLLVLLLLCRSEKSSKPVPCSKL